MQKTCINKVFERFRIKECLVSVAWVLGIRSVWTDVPMILKENL